MNNKIDATFWVAIALIVLSIASRFLAVAPNFSPIMAVALFSGVFFANRKIGFLIPITAMFISDLIIGLHPTMIAVYASFTVISLIGINMKAVSAKNVLLNSITSAIIFFVITNFAVWAMGWYSYTLLGLATCFEMAIPFFKNTLTSSLMYSAVLFCGFYLAEKYMSVPAKA